MEKPEYTLYCCGNEAKWVVQTPKLAYFYCTECKNEVVQTELPKGLEQDYDYWGGSMDLCVKVIV